MNFCSWGFSFYCFRWVIIKLWFHHRGTPFGLFTVAIVTRFDTIRSFTRLPARGDRIHFALDIKKIRYQCCRVPELHIACPQTTECSIGKGGNVELDWNVCQRRLYKAEGRSEMFSVVFASEEKKKDQIYHSAAIQLRGEKNLSLCHHLQKWAKLLATERELE